MSPSQNENRLSWRIAIVEDDPGIRNFIREAVEQEGWISEAVGSAAGAMALVQTHPPDLIVLDLGLPDMDGNSLIRKIRKELSVPIVVLSARSQESEKVMALDCGADDYLTKPIGSSELKARLRAHLRRKQGLSPVVQIGNLCINLESHQVMKGGVEIHLTPLEFKIMAILCHKLGKVVTQREILTEIWGIEHSESAQYLRIHVGHLRAKIEDVPAMPRYILTELGVGYRLSE